MPGLFCKRSPILTIHPQPWLFIETMPLQVLPQYLNLHHL